jgi:hypothetical protein
MRNRSLKINDAMDAETSRLLKNSIDHFFAVLNAGHINDPNFKKHSFVDEH